MSKIERVLQSVVGKERLARLAACQQLMCGGVWGDHPRYPAELWMDRVADGDTRLGYWEWVGVSIDMKDTSTEDD